MGQDWGIRSVLVTTPLIGSGCIQMSTAIIVAYTENGFVVAADGRSLDSRDPTKHDDSVQKIFPIEDAARALAFAVSGAAVIGSDAGEDFSFVAEANHGAQALRSSAWSDLEGYGREFARIINKALRKAKDTGRIAAFPTSKNLAGERGTTIARIVLAGYYSDQPSRIEVRFRHDNEGLSHPEITTGHLEFAVQWGSERIAKIWMTDQRFAAHRPLLTGHMSMIEHAVKIATGYIAACSDPAALQIDEEICRGIGGRIHAATITPSGGFHWVPGYEPLSDRPRPGRSTSRWPLPHPAL